MKITEKIKCAQFPCTDINKDNYLLPSGNIDTGKIRILMVTEAPPAEKSDYFYAPGNPGVTAVLPKNEIEDRAPRPDGKTRRITPLNPKKGPASGAGTR